MADILIYRMEMPKTCADCPMCYDMMECTVSPLRFWHGRPENEQFDFCNERHQDCPLRELPPHGDLIERNPLVKLFNSRETDEKWGWLDVEDLLNALVIVPSNKEESK